MPYSSWEKCDENFSKKKFTNTHTHTYTHTQTYLRKRQKLYTPICVIYRAYNELTHMKSVLITLANSKGSGKPVHSESHQSLSCLHVCAHDEEMQMLKPKNHALKGSLTTDNYVFFIWYGIKIFLVYLFSWVLSISEGIFSASVLQHWASLFLSHLALFWASLRAFLASAFQHRVSLSLTCLAFSVPLWGHFWTSVLQYWASLSLNCLALFWTSLRPCFSLCTSALCLLVSYLFSSVLSLFEGTVSASVFQHWASLSLPV